MRTAGPGEMLGALSRYPVSPDSPILVLRNGQLMGIVTPQKISELLLVQRALRRLTAPPSLSAPALGKA